MDLRRHKVGAGGAIMLESAGGGGWGDPLERDPAAVLRDVRDGYVSRQAALAEYGVVLDPSARTVDAAATAAHRVQLRARRGAATPPFVDRGPLPATLHAAEYARR